MLKVEMNPSKEDVIILAEGSTKDILFDISILINNIFWEMHESDPCGARAFKEILMLLVANEGSPVWRKLRGPKLDNPEREDFPCQ